MPNQEHEREIKHIATGTYPQPRGWTTPCSSWRARGWWRWPLERDSPLRQGAGTGLDLFLVAIEACGGGTPDLGYFLEVSVFIGIFGVGNKSGGPRVVHKIGRRARGVGRAPTLVDGPGLFYSGGFFCSIKKSSKIDTSVGLRLVFLFCKTQKQRKNRNWHWALG